MRHAFVPRVPERLGVVGCAHVRPPAQNAYTWQAGRRRPQLSEVNLLELQVACPERAASRRVAEEQRDVADDERASAQASIALELRRHRTASGETPKTAAASPSRAQTRSSSCCPLPPSGSRAARAAVQGHRRDRPSRRHRGPRHEHVRLRTAEIFDRRDQADVDRPPCSSRAHSEGTS